MQNRVIRLSKPLYEMLPYGYIVGGLLAFLAAYLLQSELGSELAILLGTICLLAGLVILLRRRDYRATRAQYSGMSLDEP